MKTCVCFFRVSFLFGALLFAAGTAHADINVRQGRHGSFGRLVFEFLNPETFQTHRDGNVLTIQFTPAQTIPTMQVDVPGIRTLQGGEGKAVLQLSSNAEPHIYRLGYRLVVDSIVGTSQPLVDQNPLAGRSEAPHKSHLEATRVAAGASKLPVSETAKAPKIAPPPVTAILEPAPVSKTGMPPPLTPSPTPMMINFELEPGAAAFRRGNEAVIVFDTAEIPDLTALLTIPAFAGAALTSLQDAQVISMPLPSGQSLVLTPATGGWEVAEMPCVPNTAAPPQTLRNSVQFPTSAANKTVIVSDPVTGGDLLVGTVNQSGPMANFQESGPGFAVLPAWLGVVIIPQADDLGLNAGPAGFQLGSAAPNGLALGIVPGPIVDASVAAAFGQSLNLPGGDTADLRTRMLNDMHAVAILPPLGRLNAQIALADDMISLGLGPEARGVVDTAVLENPAAQDNGEIVAIRAVADVLSHWNNPDDFAAPGIVPSKELSFWQAAAKADHGQIEQAAPALAADAAIFETYPVTLRNTINAEIAEALVDAGQFRAAQQLLNSDPDNPALDLARARLLERSRNAASALLAYQKLSRSDDPRVSAIANDRMIELQLAAGKLSPDRAANALDAALFDWREPEHERHLRLRIAELRAKAGQWPQAFTMLQSARTLYPNHQHFIDAIRSALFLQMLASKQFAQLSAVQAVSVLEQNQDLIPAGAGSAGVVNLLAERLDALDLPGAAAPMLSQLIQTVPQGEAQARLGATLAQVDLDAGSPAAALADLSETQADGLPPALVSQRALLNTKAQAEGGNALAAVATLAPATDLTSLTTQAQIAEQSGQWPAAEQALSSLVRQSVPATGSINSANENLLLRLATAAAHNNDSATLSALSTQYSSRVGSDPAGQMLQALTAPPLNGDQGLTQALHQIAQLQALPALMDAVAGPPHSAAAVPASRP